MVEILNLSEDLELLLRQQADPARLDQLCTTSRAKLLLHFGRRYGMDRCPQTNKRNAKLGLVPIFATGLVR